MDANFVIVYSLLILCESCGYAVSGHELDSGDKYVRQLGNFDFTDNTTLVYLLVNRTAGMKSDRRL